MIPIHDSNSVHHAQARTLPATLGQLNTLIDPACIWEALSTDANLNFTVLNADGTVLHISAGSAAFVGLTPEQVIGRNIVSLLAPEAGTERLEIVRRTLRGDKPVLVCETLGGLPLYTIVHRITDQHGSGMAVLCLHHVGSATAEISLDPNRYDIVRPPTQELSPLSKLTPRERQVLQLIALGASQQQIAHSIHRTIKTVEWHRASLGRKLKANSRVELARLAIRFGLVKLDEALPLDQAD